MQYCSEIEVLKDDATVVAHSDSSILSLLSVTTHLSAHIWCFSSFLQSSWWWSSSHLKIWSNWFHIPQGLIDDCVVFQPCILLIIYFCSNNTLNGYQRVELVLLQSVLYKPVIVFRLRRWPNPKPPPPLSTHILLYFDRKL